MERFEPHGVEDVVPPSSLGNNDELPLGGLESCFGVTSPEQGKGVQPVGARTNESARLLRQGSDSGVQLAPATQLEERALSRGRPRHLLIPFQGRPFERASGNREQVFPAPRLCQAAQRDVDGSRLERCNAQYFFGESEAFGLSAGTLQGVGTQRPDVRARGMDAQHRVENGEGPVTLAGGEQVPHVQSTPTLRSMGSPFR
jgi:hypothetical protein